MSSRTAQPAHQAICIAVAPSRVTGDTTGLAAKAVEQILVRAVMPAASACGMLALRLDPSLLDNVADPKVLDQVLLSDIAVFELSHPDTEVAYLLGTRLTFRPGTSLILQREGAPTPLKASFDGALTYHAKPLHEPDDASLNLLRANIESRLSALARREALGSGPDYAFYELVTDYHAKHISRVKTDEFRGRVVYSEEVKKKLAGVRQLDASKAILSLHEIESGLNPFDECESSVLVDLFLSYRAHGAWSEMLRLYEALPATLKRSTMLREQLAMAMNRNGDRAGALGVLEDVESVQGPSSESSALIGRVHKDLWNDSLRAGDTAAATEHLRNAIAAYRRGFEADWRDAYPGVNAVTLLDIHGAPESLQLRDRMLPVVRYAAEQRLAQLTPDYWDYATLMELAVIEGDAGSAQNHLRKALEMVRESWELATTANNLGLLRHTRAQRGEPTSWLDVLVAELTGAS
jgi:tetratricopeptide (TPR) repeat protein